MNHIVDLATQCLFSLSNGLFHLHRCPHVQKQPFLKLSFLDIISRHWEHPYWRSNTHTVGLAQMQRALRLGASNIFLNDFLMVTDQFYPVCHISLRQFPFILNKTHSPFFQLPVNHFTHMKGDEGLMVSFTSQHFMTACI